MNFLNSRGAVVKLRPIAEVTTEWVSPLAAFEDTLVHEQEITALINNLKKIAVEDNDFASSNMLDWFIDEQVEEEQNARDIIDALEKISDSKYGLYMYDKELAARAYTLAAPLATAAN